MYPRIISLALLVAITCCHAAYGQAPMIGRGPAIRPMPGAPAPKAPSVPWNEAEIVFVGKLTEATPGPTAMSLPPIHTTRMAFDVEQVLRGKVDTSESLKAFHSIQQNAAPKFDVGKTYLVAASDARGNLKIDRIELATDDKIAKAEQECGLPLGWVVVDGKLVSPWATLKDFAWPEDVTIESDNVCEKTGRPALLCGPGVEMTVEKVPPAEEIKWTNPDGDGEYKITITNKSDEAVTIPALLTSGDKILWNESIVIGCQNANYVAPGCAKTVPADVQPLTLAPGEGVSTVVNALALRGPNWPRGGYRIEFQFRLGELGETKSFYYMSRHHDAIRDKAQAE